MGRNRRHSQCKGAKGKAVNKMLKSEQGSLCGLEPSSRGVARGDEVKAEGSQLLCFMSHCEDTGLYSE